MITYPNLYHLKYFADAVQLGSISAAAQKNLVTHPAISRAISSLENHLGFELMEHQKKAFKVTKKGYQVAEQAQILLTAAADFGILNKTTGEKAAVVLKIGISRTIADIYLGSLLQKLKAEFPSLVAQVRFGTTNDILESVASGAVDIGFTIGSQNLATLKQTVIQEGEFRLVQNAKSSAAKVQESKSFIITEPRVETEKLRAGYSKKFASELPVLFEISSWESIGQLVQKGMGIGLLPDISVENWKKGSYQVLKQDWFECSYQIVCHSLKTQAHNKAIEFASRNLLT